MRPVRHALACAIASLLSSTAGAAAAERAEGRGHERELEEITVTATPLPGQDLVQPAAILAGAELEDRRAATIGDTVSHEVGVQSSYFGPGVGRPIIRGLEGGRVQVLSGGVGALDVSTVSVDHAVTIEPFLAEQIEVLKGPATLLYGSGAIGGIVNVVDGRIPEIADNGLHGRAEVRTNTNSGEIAGMGRVDFSNASHGLHVDFASRHTDDYEIGGDEDEPLENSAIETTSGAVGYSHFGDYGFAGVSLSRYDTLYGIPGGHSHGHDDGHDGEDDDEEEGHDEESVRIDMKQTRVDFKAGLDAPFAGVERILLRGAHNDYAHDELEGGEVGTHFENQAWEGRVEAIHSTLGPFDGAVGLQLVRRDFEAVGEEAFVPPSRTDDVGVFLLEQAELGAVTLELGARYDDVEIETADGRSAGFGASSLSAGAIWAFAEGFDLHLNLDRAQRAPSSEELFSAGVHVATQAFEIGDATIEEETARSIELGLHFERGRIETGVSAYYTDFAEFIYLSDTGDDDAESGLPIRLWRQEDARFRGFEAELELTLVEGAIGKLDARVFADTIHAALDTGENLPRIAPSRTGASLRWTRGPWRASLGALRYARQDDVAPFETATDGYTLIDAQVSYAFALPGGSELELFANGTNLTDRDAHVHTSFLKDESPLPGRALSIGLRAYW